MANLNSLAALAALGYMAQRGFGGDKTAPAVETTGTTAPAMPAAQDTSSITDDMRQRAFDEGKKISEGERVSTYKPNPYDVEDARTVSNVRNANPSKPAVKKAQANPRDRELGMGRGSNNFDPRNSAEAAEAYGRSARGPALADQRPASSYMPPVARTNTYNDIPTGGYPTVTDGERIDSSELGRNISNTMAAMGPGKLAGLGAIGNEMRMARMAGQNAPSVAQAGREAVTNPLAWMAGPKGMAEMQAAETATRTAKGAKAAEVSSKGREAVTNPLEWAMGPKNSSMGRKTLSEADTTGGAVGYRKGGAVKKMAKGGMTSTVSSASKRADGIASKGKTRCKIC